MKIHCIIHADFEKPGFIEEWAKANGHDITETHTYKEESLKNIADFDLLVVMGGPQSPLAIDESPYLKDEIDFIKKALTNKKGIVGICLGAQLIAEALGVKTQKSHHKEIGMFPITLTDDAKQDPIFNKFPSTFDVMHWHNDMPGISHEVGLVLLAKSEGCPHQAFRYGDRVYGLQFHLESTLELIKGMIHNCPEDLKPGQYIRTMEQLLESNFYDINAKMQDILVYMSTILCPEGCVEQNKSCTM